MEPCQSCFTVLAGSNRAFAGAPAEHPKIKPLFEPLSALSKDEIEQLLEYKLSPTEEGRTIRQFVESHGCPMNRFVGLLHRLGFKPIGKIGQSNLYKLDDLAHVAAKLKHDTEVYMRKFNRAFHDGNAP